MTSEWESANIPGLYFMGTLMQQRDYRKTMSSFIHGFRHNVESLGQMLGRKYEGESWRRHRQIPLRAEEIAEAVIQRVSLGTSIFLQPGFLCDLIVCEDGESYADYYEGMPVDYVHDNERARRPGKRRSYYLIMLEYSNADDTDPSEDFYLHPVIRCYEGSAKRPVRRFFLPDNLDNDWRRNPRNVQFLRRFFSDQLSARRSKTVAPALKSYARG